MLVEAKFDVLKLAPARWAALEAPLQLQLVRLLQQVPADQWAAKGSFLVPLLAAYTQTPRASMHAALERLLVTCLHSSRLFAGHPTEAAVWLRCLPPDAPAGLLKAFEAVLGLCTQQLPAWFDRAAELARLTHAAAQRHAHTWRGRLWAAIAAAPGLPLWRRGELIQPTTPFSPFALAALETAFRKAPATLAADAEAHAQWAAYTARVAHALAPIGPANALFLLVALHGAATGPLEGDEGAAAAAEVDRAAAVVAAATGATDAADVTPVAAPLHAAVVTPLAADLQRHAAVRPSPAAAAAVDPAPAPLATLLARAATAAAALHLASALQATTSALAAEAERAGDAALLSHAAAAVLNWLCRLVLAPPAPDDAGASPLAVVLLAFRLVAPLAAASVRTTLRVGGAAAAAAVAGVPLQVASHPLVTRACAALEDGGSDPVERALLDAVRAGWATVLQQLGAAAASSDGEDAGAGLRTSVHRVLLQALTATPRGSSGSGSKDGEARVAEAATLFHGLRATFGPAERASLLDALLQAPDARFGTRSTWLQLLRDAVDAAGVGASSASAATAADARTAAVQRMGAHGVARLVALYEREPSASLSAVLAQLVAGGAAMAGAAAPRWAAVVAPAVHVTAAAVRAALLSAPADDAECLATATVLAGPFAHQDAVLQALRAALDAGDDAGAPDDRRLALAAQVAHVAVVATDAHDAARDAGAALGAALALLREQDRAVPALAAAARARDQLEEAIRAWQVAAASKAAAPEWRAVATSLVPRLLRLRALPPPLAEEDDAGRAAHAHAPVPAAVCWSPAELAVAAALARHAASEVTAACADVLQRTQLVDRGDTRWRWASGWMLLAALVRPQLPAALAQQLWTLAVHDLSVVLSLSAADERPGLETVVFGTLGTPPHPGRTGSTGRRKGADSYQGAVAAYGGASSRRSRAAAGGRIGRRGAPAHASRLGGRDPAARARCRLGRRRAPAQPTPRTGTALNDRRRAAMKPLTFARLRRPSRAVADLGGVDGAADAALEPGHCHRQQQRDAARAGGHARPRAHGRDWRRRVHGARAALPAAGPRARRGPVAGCARTRHRGPLLRRHDEPRRPGAAPPAAARRAERPADPARGDAVRLGARRQPR